LKIPQALLAEFFLFFQSKKFLSYKPLNQPIFVMKKTTFLTGLCAAAAFSANAQTPITIDNSLYTNEELVNNILIDAACVGVSSVIVHDGAPYGIPSIGLFNGAGTTFPFSSGLVLSTGNITTLPGPTSNITSSGANGWGGDADLLALNTAQGNTMALNNATSIEFDFVPLIPHIGFDFIFASNEYGTFQCSYSDIFAFILTDMETGEQSNLAVVPGTVTPISVTTIRNSAYNSQCSSVNSAYFGQYYLNDPAAPVNLRGRTVPMTAESDVQIGHLYHIKMAIADYADSAFDSAVFINGASFDIGSLASEYLAINSSQGEVLCNGQETQLSVPYMEGFTYQWSLNGEAIDGAVLNTVTVGNAGVYELEATSPAETCTGVYSYSLSFGITEEQTNNFAVPNLTVPADENGEGTFDFATLQATVLALYGEGYTLNFYNSYTDADMNWNPLPLIYTTAATEPQMVYARLESATGCYIVTGFVISAEVISATDNQTFKSLAIYPNPATDRLTITNNTALDKVELYNILGQRQLSAPASGIEAQIGLSTLTPGIYIVKVFSGDAQAVSRLIIE
jgi:Secretion system C-terminal sorting domain